MANRLENLEDLLPDVMIDIPECSDRVALHALRHCCARFLRKTELWKTVLYGDIVTDSRTVSLTMTEDAMIEKYLKIKVKVSDADIFTNLNQYPPYHFSGDVSGSLSFSTDFAPENDISSGVQAFVVLVPDVHTGYCPTSIIREFNEAIVMYAKSELSSANGKPYTNPDFGQYCMQKYNTYLTEILNKIARDRQNYIGSFYS